MKSKLFPFALALSLFCIMPIMESCNKSTCPTYDLSGPTKKRKKSKKKDSLRPWDTKKVNKRDNGKSTSGVTPQ